MEVDIQTGCSNYTRGWTKSHTCYLCD